MGFFLQNIDIDKLLVMLLAGVKGHDIAVCKEVPVDIKKEKALFYQVEGTTKNLRLHQIQAMHKRASRFHL